MDAAELIVDPDRVPDGAIFAATLGVLVTSVLHLWKANMLLSIAGGTTSYVLLMSTIFSTT